MALLHHRRLTRVGVALFLPLAAAYLLLFAGASQVERLFPLVLVISVVVSAWYGGRGVGMLAAGVGVLLVLAAPLALHHRSYNVLRYYGAAQVVESSALVLAALVTGWLHETRERAEAALRERDARLRLVSGQLPAVLWSTDRDLRLTTGMGNAGQAASGAQAASGQAASGAEAGTFLAHLNLSDPASPAAVAHRGALLGTPASFETHWGERAFACHVEPLRSPEGEIFGVVGVALDITDRKEAERRLREAKDQAETATRAKDRFLAMLSHELRTPLTPALVAAAELQARTDLAAAARDDVDLIRRNVELEVRLIDDLLDLTRIAQGKMAMRFRTEDAHQLLHAAMDICREEAAAKGVLLTVSTCARAHHVRGDGARLRQVFWNLLKNSIKFTPAGGEVSVHTRESDTGMLCVEVTDTGVGIDPELLPHVFNAFEQGGANVTKSFGGLGLGLAISKTIVEAHGGRITPTSPGRHQGATFRVELPTVAPAPEPAATPGGNGKEPAEPERRARPLRILLVEDHPDTSRLLRRLLAASGHHVTTADSVESALLAAESEPVDLVVSDIGLPDGSGCDLMRKLTQRQTRPVKGIALSGYGMDSDLERSRLAGFDRHLTKPVDFKVLEETIEQVAAG